MLVNNEGIGFLVHAICCLFIYMNCLFPVMQYYGCLFLLFELSTPLLHIRQFFILAKKNSGALFSLVQYSFALVFFLVRLVGGFYMSYYWWAELAPPWWNGQLHSFSIMSVYFAINLVLNVLNTFWFAKIIRGGRKERKTGPRKSD